MSNVLDLKNYRGRRRKELWARHGQRIDRFVREYLETRLVTNIHDLLDTWQELQREDEQEAWAYDEFRSRMVEAILLRHGTDLRARLAAQKWFDPALISTEEVAEMCLTSIVLGDSAPVGRKYR
ncbi:MAG: hypothetical protein RIQ81_1267 [Pseudomonadota bacterium]|jgi:hypothetical protein